MAFEKYQDSKERIEKIEKNYDAKARRIFSKPANFCQFCKGPIEKHENPMTDRWQQRWSIHATCAQAIDNQLDREVGIASERRQR